MEWDVLDSDQGHFLELSVLASERQSLRDVIGQDLHCLLLAFHLIVICTYSSHFRVLSSMPSLYEILGVPPTATKAESRSSFSVTT
jgi:hypothetical protein